MDGDRANGSRVEQALEDDDCTSCDFVMLSHQDESIVADASADAIEKLHLSFNSGGSDIPIEEAEGHVKDLMKENIVLRENLQKHTAMLCRQYETFQAWQKQFSEANASVQKSLDMSRANEEAIRKERDLKAASETHYQELAKKMKQENDAKEAEIGELRGKQKSLEDTITELSDRVNSLEEALQQKETENKALSERCKEAIERMDFFGSRTDRTPSVAVTTLGPMSSFTSVSDLESCAAKDAAGPASLTTKLAEVTVHLHNEQSKTARQSQEISSLTAEVASLADQLQESARNVAALEAQVRQFSFSSSETASQAKRLSNLEGSIVQKDAQLQKWRAENESLQRRFDEKKSEVGTLRRALLEAEHRQVVSQRNYDELLKTWQEYESSGERAFVSVEHGDPNGQRAVKEKIKDLESQTSILRAALDEKDQQLIQLRRANEGYKQQLELLPPLRAQLEVYSSDYATEKEQRISAQAQITELQEHLRQLREEMGNSGPQERDGEALQEVGADHFQANNALGGLPCPLCTRRCATQQAYIDHVQACVEGTEPCGP